MRRSSILLWRFGVFALVAGVLLLVWALSPPSAIATFAQGAPSTWAKLDDERRLYGSSSKHSYVSLDVIPLDVQFAAVAGEDIGFCLHRGFEVSAIEEALQEWWSAGNELRGASTITQQLAKNLFLSGDRSLWRKVQEARYAYWLERRLGKRRILELYLNVVELGPSLFGVSAAAQHYFGTKVGGLDAVQAAELAASIPSPLKHNPTTRTKSWQIRYRAIRERMGRYDNVRRQLVQLPKDDAM